MDRIYGPGDGGGRTAWDDSISGDLTRNETAWFRAGLPCAAHGCVKIMFTLAGGKSKPRKTPAGIASLARVRDRFSPAATRGISQDTPPLPYPYP